MAKKARKFSTEFKLEAVRRMADAPSIVGLAQKLGVRRKLLYEWRERFEAEGSRGWSGAEAGRQGASQTKFFRRR